MTDIDHINRWSSSPDRLQSTDYYVDIRRPKRVSPILPTRRLHRPQRCVKIRSVHQSQHRSQFAQVMSVTHWSPAPIALSRLRDTSDCPTDRNWE